MEEVPGDEGKLNYVRGRVFQLHDEGEDGTKVIDAFEKASKYGDAPSRLWRDLGDVYQSSGQREKAVTAFKTYIQKDPTASDKALIEFMIKDLEGT